MATIEDIQRKHNQFITSQDNIVNMIASYGVGITNDTPFQQYADMVEEAVSTKEAGIIDGETEFRLDERDFKKITSIRRYAFYNNTKLVSVVIPENIRVINNTAFNGCTGLKTVVIKGYTSILTSSFGNCSALEKFYLPKVTSVDKIPVLGNLNVFTSINSKCIFCVPDAESLELYKEASNWNTIYDTYKFEIEEAMV